VVTGGLFAATARALSQHARHCDPDWSRARLCGDLSHLGTTYLAIAVVLRTMPPFASASLRTLVGAR